MENKDKYPFICDSFFSNPSTLPSVLNKLICRDLITSQDMYESGDFLSMQIVDNAISRNILSEVISDIDAYERYATERFIPAENGSIELAGLDDIHSKHFGGKNELMWNKNTSVFTLIE